jgi:site-specific DNA-cytosine methylase
MKTGKDVSFCIDSNYHKGTNTTLKSRRQLVLEQREREESSMKKEDIKKPNPNALNEAAKIISNLVKPEPSDKFFEEIESTNSNITTVAYSKSTRKNHIDVRGRVDQDANTISTGDGGANMSTQNFVAEEASSQSIRIRKLTPTETERLQGYKDDHTKFGKKEDGTIYELSNTQRYKICGNGVSSPVSATILTTLIPGDEEVRVQSLFSGGLGTELDLPERFKLTGTCEFDKYASDLIRFHKPNVPNFHDVTKFVERNDVPDFDLLTFGFPCQSFSIAGLRQGFEDEKGRGTLIYNVFDIIKKHKPKYILGENVKGLLNHDGGKPIIQILTGLSQLGYELDFELVNSKHYGLAQNRERVFIFGRLK